jgi:hypothetical protein
MRVILRNRKTGLYYGSCDQWVADASQAIEFEEIEDPCQLAFEEGLTELELVVSCENSNRELVLPLRLERHARRVARLAA